MPPEDLDLPTIEARWAVRIGRICAGMGMYVPVREDKCWRERRICRWRGWYRVEGINLGILSNFACEERVGDVPDCT
jgi:hypothetical protein